MKDERRKTKDERGRTGIGFAATVAGVTLVMAGCAGDFVEDPTRPRPTRAVESPLGMSSPNSEAMGGAMGAVPLVTVELPNRREDQAVVHTIAEPLAALAQTAPAAPATRGAAPEPATRAAGPVAEEAPIRVIQKKNAADTVVAISMDEKVALVVTCQSGIGTAVLERTGEEWPTSIAVRFSYGERPFTRLEGFNAAELTEAGGRVALKAEANRDAATATISIPRFVRSSRISIEWVDMYR